MSSVRNFRGTADAFARLVTSVGPEQWDAPALDRWTVRQLAGHTARAILTVETYLRHDEPGSVGIRTAEEYYSTVYPALCDPTAIEADGVSAGLWLAGLGVGRPGLGGLGPTGTGSAGTGSAGTGLGGSAPVGPGPVGPGPVRSGPVGSALGGSGLGTTRSADAASSTVADALARAASLIESQPPGRAISIGGMGIPLDEYLRTRVVELVLHTLDLSTATGIPADLPEEAVADAAALVTAVRRHLLHGEQRLLELAHPVSPAA